MSYGSAHERASWRRAATALRAAAVAAAAVAAAATAATAAAMGSAAPAAVAAGSDDARLGDRGAHPRHLCGARVPDHLRAARADLREQGAQRDRHLGRPPRR